MPFADNNGVRTFYEVAGTGPALVLAHWSTDTSSIWHKLGYVDALKDDYSVVLFDARGYGQSDKPHTPSDYESQLMVKDAIAVLDDLGIDRAHFWGYSMGARTGFRIAVQSAERFRSFILGGCSPYAGKAEKQFLDAVLEDLKLLITDPERAVRKRERTFGRALSYEEKDSFLSSDAEALLASGTGRFAWPPLTDEELSSIAAPCLVYCGDADPAHNGAQEGVRHMRQATFVSLPGLDHTQVFVQKDKILPYVKGFLATVGDGVG